MASNLEYLAQMDITAVLLTDCAKHLRDTEFLRCCVAQRI